MAKQWQRKMTRAFLYTYSIELRGGERLQHDFYQLTFNLLHYLLQKVFYLYLLQTLV